MSASFRVLLLASSAIPAFAQFEVAGRPVQVHGFFSQGFAYSDQNNFLTLPTSKGSFALTDGGLNMGANLTDKLRVGAQGYVHKFGQLGKGQVTLDYAQVDYRFNDRFGVRAGKVKTLVGLYGDTDVEALQTWALSPQSVYPLDSRSTRTAYFGADVYGETSAGMLGSINYEAFAGRVSSGLADGTAYGAAGSGIRVQGYKGPIFGGAIRLQTHIPALLLQISGYRARVAVRAFSEFFGEADGRTSAIAQPTILSGQYSPGNFRFDAEYVINNSDDQLYLDIGGAPARVSRTLRHGHDWYVSGAYRVDKYLELGTYHSRINPTLDPRPKNQPEAERRIADQAVTARFDVNRYVDVKVEGHFMDGYADAMANRGFYTRDNPHGLKPRTDLLVIRLGFIF